MTSYRLLSMILLAITSATSAAERPTANYIVEHVLIDPALDNFQQRFFRDDPRLMDRGVTLSSSMLDLESYGSPCRSPTRTVVRQTPAAMLATLRRRNVNQKAAPDVADFGLQIAAHRPVAVTRYACATSGSTTSAWVGAQSFKMPDGRLVILWAREVLLIVGPIGPAAAQSSFMCARARTASEKAICNDRVLAGWDRSVARTIRALASDAEDYPSVDVNELRASQRAWLVQRDRCGAERQCLLDRMEDRVQTLLDRNRRSRFDQ